MNQLLENCELEKGLYAIVRAYDAMLNWHRDGWFLGGISGDHILLFEQDLQYKVQFLDWSCSFVKKSKKFPRLMQFSITKKPHYPDFKADQDPDDTAALQKLDKVAMALVVGQYAQAAIAKANSVVRKKKAE